MLRIGGVPMVRWTRVILVLLVIPYLPDAVCLIRSHQL